MTHNRQLGVTLIELILVISLLGIIAAIAGRNITRPVTSFIDLNRRSALVDAAQLALNRITREIRLALPNSVRLTNTDASIMRLSSCTASVGSSCSVEILRTLDGGRYREEVDTSVSGPGDTLDFSSASDSFDVLENLNNIGAIQIDASATDESSCFNGISDCLVIYNLGQNGADAYEFDNIASIVSTAPFTFARSSVFPFQSPQQRFHVVDTPVTFNCNSASRQINRVDSYSISDEQDLLPSGTTHLLIDSVERCVFHYSQGTASRNAVLSVQITISETNQSGSAERVTLMQQVRVPNIP